MTMRALSLIVLLGVGACADPVRPQRDGVDGPATRYVASGTVMQAPARGAELCVGAVMESYPPQCEGIPIPNWDWSKVAGEETAGGSTWGEYRIVGTYDGETFTVVHYQAPPPSPATTPRFDTPCPEPQGGWEARDPSRTGHDDLAAATAAAQAVATHAGLWIDTRGNRDSSRAVLNVAFTDDPKAHEATIRAHWGGPLCLLKRARAMRELRRIQDELTDGGAESRGMEMLSVAVNEIENRVDLEVVVVPEGAQDQLDAAYGRGAVRVTGALQPLA